MTLAPADTFLASVVEGLAGHGAQSAVVRLRGGTLERLVYLGPSLSADDRHAAWYSGPHDAGGPAEIEDLVMVVGQRDGAPFLHGHGVWRAADGRRIAGHILADEARLAAPVEAQAVLVAGAIMDQSEDLETNFRLFAPSARAGRYPFRSPGGPVPPEAERAAAPRDRGDGPRTRHPPRHASWHRQPDRLHLRLRRGHGGGGL